MGSGDLYSGAPVTQALHLWCGFPNPKVFNHHIIIVHDNDFHYDDRLGALKGTILAEGMGGGVQAWIHPSQLSPE